MYKIPLFGYQPVSFSDHPFHVSSILFLQGCNLDCKWCHNLSQAHDKYATIGDIIEQLPDYSNIRKGVVLSGGEPTIHTKLPQLCEYLNDTLGLSVALYTNGTNQQVLLSCLQWLDYVALDIKPETDQEAINNLILSDVEYELRVVAINPISDVADTLNKFSLPKRVKIVPYVGSNKQLVVTDSEVRNLRREF